MIMKYHIVFNFKKRRVFEETNLITTTNAEIFLAYKERRECYEIFVRE